ncbi:hypothetical protein BRD56_02790 [Thermoplasmatales archaeon SW_10_69_26]|nr:MAG: hypothetical protein BRD56_02790 [Thermoplasmatales archaeon SW_10_69_26]
MDIRRLCTAAVLLSVVFIGGCLEVGSDAGGSRPAGDASEENQASPVTELPAEVNVSYPCPEGATFQPTGDVCAGLIEDPLRTLGEPFQAVHPTDPATIAVGVMEGKAQPSGQEENSGAENVGLAVYVTTDAGESWERNPIPLGDVPETIPARDRSGADPSLVFDEAGRLHFTGLISFQEPPGEPSDNPGFVEQSETRVFAMRSTDLGDSWEHETLLAADTDHDRQWLTGPVNGILFTSWRNQPNSTSSIATSTDAGETWRTPGNASLLESCDSISPVEATSAGLLVACEHDGQFDVYELDPVTGGLDRLAAVEGGCPVNSPFLANPIDDVIVSACYGGQMAHSPDGGETWNVSIDVIEEATVNEDWPEPLVNPFVYAMGAGADGYVHVLFTHSPATFAPYDRGQRPVAHVVLHPANLTIVAETELKPPETSTESNPSPNRGPADDYYDVEVVDDRTMLTWTTNEWATAYAFAETGS